MPTSVLTVNGTAYAISARAANRIRLRQWSWDVKGTDQLEFAHVGIRYNQAFAPHSTVSLTIDGTLRFSGRIAGLSPEFGPFGLVVTYRCLGPSYLADRLTVTAPDGTGAMVFNREPSDPLYNASLAGRSVGQIVKAVLDQHASQLTAIGVGSYTVGDFSGGAMDVVPPEPIQISGEGLWAQLRSFLGRWARLHVLYIEPGGNIRCHDTAAWGTSTLTIGTDPIEPVTLPISLDDCATRVRVRGRGKIRAAVLSTRDGTLVESSGWDKPNWTWAKFARPTDAYSSGTLSGLTSTSVTFTPTAGLTSWAANYWSNISGTIVLLNSLSNLITAIEDKRITSNGATSGGSATITWSGALANSGYDKAYIYGTPPGISNTWRLYEPANAAIKAALVPRFPRPIAAANAAGTAASLTTYPVATVGWSSTGNEPLFERPWPMELLLSTGQIRFVQPTVKAFGQQSDLDTGGFTTRTSTNGVPADVRAIVPFSAGVLEAYAPSSSTWGGTAYTLYGFQREYTIDVDSWELETDQTNMNALADMYWKAMRDATVEGSVTHNGLWSSGLAPGVRLNVTGAGYVTGYEAIDAPILSASVSWSEDGGRENVHVLNVSTRRQPATGDRLFTPPPFGVMGPGLLESIVGGGEWVAAPGVLRDSSGRYVNPPEGSDGYFGP